MAVLLYRLGRFAAHRRWVVLALWLVILAAVGGAAAGFGGKMSDSFSIPNTPAQNAIDELSSRIPGSGGSTGRIVFRAPDGHTLAEPVYQAAVEQAVARAVTLPGVVAAVDPFTGQVLLPTGPGLQNPTATPLLAPPNGQIGFASLQMRGQITAVPAVTHEGLADIAAAARTSGLEVQLSGAAVKQSPAIGSTEGIGVVVALVVLLIMFGSIVAAGMPMLTALIGIGIGVSGVLIFANWIDMSSTAPILALMLGLAVGIDYALFVVSRHRKQLLAGMEVRESIARATGTAGSAVVFAGLTVIIALAALSVVGIPFLTVMGVAASVTVLIAVLIAITLLPALLSFAGDRALSRKQRSRLTLGRHAIERVALRVEKENRWGRFVTRYPALVLIVGILGLGAAAIPAASLHLALPDDGVKALDSTNRKAYDLLAEGFGAGVNGPLIVTVAVPDPATLPAALQSAGAAVTGAGDVAAVSLLAMSADGTFAALNVVPKSAPGETATADLVQRIRGLAGSLESTSGATVQVTGQTALGIDVSAKLSSALPVYLVIVVGLALVLLMLVFRSIVVPIKAALGFLLSVAASFGAVVAVYQWGWFGLVETPSAIVSFLPILLIGVLFGLAMDYEVFLVAGMRESFVHGEDAKAAVRSGFTHGSRVVTAAAIIMTSVFAGFILAPDSIIASIGFALAIGVLIDAFVVRMTLVPAIMTLLGRVAWYLPAWLQRSLPNIDIEGEQLLHSLAAERTAGLGGPHGRDDAHAAEARDDDEGGDNEGGDYEGGEAYEDDDYEGGDYEGEAYEGEDHEGDDYDGRQVAAGAVPETARA